MGNELLLGYIREQRSAGFTAEAIAAALAASGWTPDDIREGFAEVDAPPSIPKQTRSAPPTAAPRTSAQLSPSAIPVAVRHVVVEPPSKKHGLFAAVAIILAVLLLLGGSAAWYVLYGGSLHGGTAPVISQDAPPAPVEPAVATSTAPEQTTVTFAPIISDVPAFSIQYPAILGTSTTTESSYSVSVLLGSSTQSGMTLTFSFFQNPLQPSQTADEYLKSIFPSGTMAKASIAGRDIVSVANPDFPAGQSLYYVFLKNKMVITVQITGSNTARDMIVRSIQFKDPIY